jgi:hypothetical protein
MKAEDIAKLINEEEEYVLNIIDPGSAIHRLDTPEKAKAFYENCPPKMEAAVVKKWEKLVIPTLDTPEKAQALYRSCPAEMEAVVLKKWKKLVKQAILALDTSEKAQALYWSCPREFQFEIIRKMATL